MFVYRPPNNQNKNNFIIKITKTLNKIALKYDHFVLAGDINLDSQPSSIDFKNTLSDLYDIFNFTNLVKTKTCFKSVNGSSVDVMLTNRPGKFQNTSTITTGLSDFHQLIVTLFHSTYQKLPPQKTYYRNYKNFHEKFFLYELDQNLLSGNIYEDKTTG